ncbi:universal stress protein [Paenibacillus spongiae]|uniref:Universal stress protein n=1 Tax=Paenibacillus spongiae TaxID=2909671 RepID=A0ABY5SCW0_9BACL|nr:universal stress protein [Paenibacillus spongiae]UVI30528.1 universal stress protein [Paenibacillus spongiae]
MLFAHVVVAFDGSVQSWKALEYAVKLVETEQTGKLSVVHVYSLPYVAVADTMLTATASMQKELYERAEALLAEAGKKVAHLPSSHVELLEGSPAQSILNYSEQNDCSLIIIGSRGLGGIREFMMGSVSHNVVQHSAIPVLIMK